MNESAEPATGSREAADAQAPSRRGRGRHIALWVLQALLALFFVLGSAFPKLTGASAAVESFEQIGLGMWFMYVVGLLELAGGLALITPWLSGLSAICLIALLIGAFTTQMTVVDGENAVFPLIMMVPIAVVAWGRRDTLAGLPRLLGR
ncbi:DoxX-like protein [Streptomyces sp. Amel2xB2]|uniref:DoxX family protein n=1 Tax=Streptomyces sp. Amel2xB2 TaxID=1305829 RepID=UPI000DBAC2CC|nr:DoxX family protein [Streptomyces sp. Amel2xB2]RAJ56476.1 DoxX-like protein [Streptomyces sp. Amel2xB2]